MDRLTANPGAKERPNKRSRRLSSACTYAFTQGNLTSGVSGQTPSPSTWTAHGVEDGEDSLTEDLDNKWPMTPASFDNHVDGLGVCPGHTRGKVPLGK